MDGGERDRGAAPADVAANYERELFELTNAKLGYDEYLMTNGKNLVLKEDGKYAALKEAECVRG